MSNRRRFLWQSLGLGALLGAGARPQTTLLSDTGPSGPMVIATWPNEPGVRLAIEALQKQARPLDAVETGVRYVESDPNDHSVGYGGLPDARGRVTLDACIMDEEGNAGSVLYLQHIMHPVTVARMVMEQTPHVILCGDGGLDFALSKGMKRENLLTPTARKVWRDQRRELGKPTVPPSGVGNHDTIGMIALAADGRMAGACSTSGLSNKLPGRVGDSPIIGAGLYVDPEVGGATATGMGEHIIKAVGSFLIVELMRQGATPVEACREAVRRINKKLPTSPDRHMVGFVALRKDGTHGAFANNDSFKYTIGDASGVKVYESGWG